MSAAAACGASSSLSRGGGGAEEGGEIAYVSYGGEQHLPLVMSLVDAELSEPYSIFTYRYFVYLWPQLTFLAFDAKDGKCVGTVVCKMGEHRGAFRGYIAMLVVLKPYRGRGIATELVTRSIRVMMESGCEVCVYAIHQDLNGAGGVLANKINAGERCKSPQEVVSDVLFHMMAWNLARQVQNKPVEQPVVPTWKVPPDDFYKINCDGAFLNGVGRDL